MVEKSQTSASTGHTQYYAHMWYWQSVALLTGRYGRRTKVAWPNNVWLNLGWYGANVPPNHCCGKCMEHFARVWHWGQCTTPQTHLWTPFRCPSLLLQGYQKPKKPFLLWHSLLFCCFCPLSKSARKICWNSILHSKRALWNCYHQD